MITGQKVVCVDGKFPLGIEKFYDALPKEGVTYTVRDVSLGVNLKGQEGEVAITLVELINPCSDTPPYPERGFKAERFRPLEEDEMTHTEEAEKEEELVTIGF
ncbi:MAG: hypothetical protein AAGA18_14135 [Verrucomicrobiota bacterium]